MTRAASQLSVRHYGASHGSHDHPHFQVLLGLDGALALEIDGRGQRVAAGEGVVIAPGARHDFESHDGARCLVLDTGYEGWERAVGRPAPASDLLPLAHYLAQAAKAGRPQACALGPTLLLEAWLPETVRTSRAPRSRRAIDWATLARWAQAHPSPPEVQHLAAQVHLSSAQFAARCQQELGQSPMQWQRRQRLAQARRWLDAGLGVAETARRSGYRSPSALTAALRREQI
jgi:AraC-like DNA-binding protein